MIEPKSDAFDTVSSQQWSVQQPAFPHATSVGVDVHWPPAQPATYVFSVDEFAQVAAGVSQVVPPQVTAASAVVLPSVPFEASPGCSR